MTAAGSTSIVASDDVTTDNDIMGENYLHDLCACSSYGNDISDLELTCWDKCMMLLWLSRLVLSNVMMY